MKRPVPPQPKHRPVSPLPPPLPCFCFVGAGAGGRGWALPMPLATVVPGPFCLLWCFDYGQCGEQDRGDESRMSYGPAFASSQFKGHG